MSTVVVSMPRRRAPKGLGPHRAEQVGELVGGALLHVGQRVAVDVERQRRAEVAQSLGNNLDVFAGGTVLRRGIRRRAFKCHHGWK